MYQVFTDHSTYINFQRCYFPSCIPSEHHGKLAFVSTSCNKTYLVKVCVQPLLKDHTCVLDESVQCSTTPYRSSPKALSYDSLEIVPSVKYIKSCHVELVFKSIWDLERYRSQCTAFKQLIIQMLELFVLANNVLVILNHNKEINKLGIHLIVIKNIGNLPAGKIVESSKLVIDHITCYERFVLKEIVPLSILGLHSNYETLKGLLVSVQNCSHNTLQQLSACLKVLIIGPDGCGKKTLLFAATQECGAVVITIDGPELCRPEPGETERVLKHRFQEAILHSKEGLAVLLLQRVESVCSREGRVSSELLHLLDSAPSSLVIIATTARPHLLHQSTATRFQTRIFINPPTEGERCEMLEGLSGGSLSKESAAELAQKTPGYVIADLKLILSKASRLSKHKSPLSLSLSEAVMECLYQVEASSVRGELGLVQGAAEGPALEDLGGLRVVKQALLQAVVWPLMHPHALARFNVHSSSGVLLYGPPGCAKTSLARALAASSRLTFLSASAADLMSPYVGDAELTLTALFHRARQAAPTLLFIDEIDVLAGDRSGVQRGAQERLLSTFLVEMDGIGVKAHSTSGSLLKAKVTVIGATNRPDCIDAALLRPGRLDRLLYVPPPSPADRREILTLLTREVPLSDCVDLDYIAEHTNLYSGADLKSLCQEAGLQALTSEGMDAGCVRQEHWLAALREIPSSLNPQQLSFYDSFSFS